MPRPPRLRIRKPTRRRNLQPPDPHRMRQPQTPNLFQRRARWPRRLPRHRRQLPARPNPMQRLAPPPPRRASPRRPNRRRRPSQASNPPTGRPTRHRQSRRRSAGHCRRRCWTGRRHRRTAARTCQWQVRSRHWQQERPHADRRLLFRPQLRAVVAHRR
jgi:hypothetical protein